MSSMSSPNRSPLSKRKSPRPEEGLYGNLLEPDMKKMRLNSTASADDGGAEVQAADDQFDPERGEFTLPNVLAELADVTNWRDLGLQLGLSTAKLDAIGTESDPKVKMITVWMDRNPGATGASWQKLVRALASPAMCENRVAKGIAERRGSSFDKESALEYQSLGSSASGVIDFTEANVRNAIVNVKLTYKLGELLKIPQGILNDIHAHQPETRKGKLVAAWFKVDPDCNWKKLENALGKIKVLEWSARKSMSGSFSEDPLSPGSNGTVGEIEEEDMHAASQAAAKNKSMIKAEYFKLKKSIARNLTKVAIDIGSLQDYAQEILGAGDSVMSADSIDKIFRVLTANRCWDFLDVSSLEELVKMFSEDQEKENMTLIKTYKERLAGYKATTKIKDYIKANKEKDSGDITDPDDTSIGTNKGKYDEKYRTKLSVKLFGDKKANVKIEVESLLYVESLWESLCDEFTMPSLPHLLDKIIAGSIIIQWLIHHDLVRSILEGISNATEFFERQFIATLHLAEVCVYDEETGVVSQKVIAYVKLLLIVQEGKKNETEDMLQDCFPEINAPIDDVERTPLLFAAVHGHQALMQPLLDHGANLYTCDREGASVLSLSKPHDDLHKWLVNETEEKFIKAAQDHEMDLIQSSLKIGVDCDTKEKDEYGWTALLWGCEKGYEDMVEYLLEQGANPNAEDAAKWTGLILSSRRGRLEIVRKLLDKGANPNQQTKTGWSSLQWTGQEGHTDVAKLLLERGADPTQHDNAGFTPLIQASQDGHLDVVKAIVEYNSEHLQKNLDDKTQTSWSAPMVATKNGHTEIVKYLAEKDFNMNHAKGDDVTALHVASYKGRADIVRYMCLTAKMEVNAQDTDGVTPLMYAVKQGDYKMTRTLIEDGRANAKIAENYNQWTALFFALEGAQNQDLKIFDYLLGLGKGRVDIEHRDRNGRTVWEITKLFDNCEEARKLLKQHYKPETERMIQQSHGKATVTIKDYQQMFDKLNSKIGAQPSGKTVAASAA